MKQIFIVLLTLFSFSLLAQSNLRINKNSNNTPSTELEQASQNPENSENNTNTKSFHINQHHNEQDNNQSPFEAVRGKKEIPSKRDQYSKTYQNEDGSFTALIGAGPIHYDNNGVWEDIDTKIIPNGNENFPYKNTTNLFSSFYGTTAHKGIKSVTAEGEVLEFQNVKMAWEVNGQTVNNINAANSSATINNDIATYPHLFGNISAEFTSLVGKRELNYVIPNAQALSNAPANAEYLVFTEEINLPTNWTATSTEKGIEVKDNTGEVIYLYPKPVSTDANLTPRQEENTIYEMHQNGSVLTLKTKVKTEWLLSEERVFPVKVDPTVNCFVNNNGVYGKGSNKSFGGYFFGQNYPGAFCETNSTSAVALQIAGAGQSPASPAFLNVGWAQFSSGNGTTQGGALLINNLAGEITIAPDMGQYGFIGTASTAWWELHYYNAIQASRRELKRDITYFDENLNAYLMDNIMAMKPSFYKYKTENDEKIPGKENRTRYNMHMGFILDETPDFIQDNTFSGIDIYSLTTLGITGVQINRRDIDKINEELTEIFDFGIAQLNGNEIYVSYNKNFNGVEPVVSITPMAAVKDYYIKSQTSTGFTIAVENANNFKFNWIAVASKPTKQNNSPIVIEANLKSQLEVDPVKKQDIHNELFINEGPQKTIELQGKDASKYNAKKFSPKIER